MRKLTLVLLGLLMVSGSAFAGYDEGFRITKKEQSGGGEADPVRVIQLVRNPNFASNGIGVNTFVNQISEGDAVLWDLISDDGVTINIVGSGNISVSNDAAAGIAVGNIPTADIQGNTASQDVGRRNWGWIQTYGHCPRAWTDASAITVGDGLRLSTTPRRVGTAAVATNSVVINSGPSTLGFAYDTSSTEGAADIFIRNR